MTKQEFEKIIQAEGNHYEFQSKGLKCVIHRNAVKAWCGYVGVDKKHKWYGRDYDDDEVSNITVHGGLTYAGKAHWSKIDDNWYFGFDCCHLLDVCETTFMFTDLYNESNDVKYCTKEYVVTECERLAEQLTKINK